MNRAVASVYHVVAASESRFYTGRRVAASTLKQHDPTSANPEHRDL